MLPTDKKERKRMPIGTGVLDYFPLAVAEVARVSHAGNEQHNPGEPLHWAREKSTDHADCIIRHFLERGTLDEDGQRHSGKMAWRALALLELELEALENTLPVPVDYPDTAPWLDEAPNELAGPIADATGDSNSFEDVKNGYGQLQGHSALPAKSDGLVRPEGPVKGLGTWSGNLRRLYPPEP